MKTILGLSYLAALPVAVTFLLYLVNRNTAFGRLGERTKQLIYGLVFGGLAVIGSEFGVDVGGASANTRDACVLTAGLVFGSPAGIIAGVIGGLERFLSVYWGGGVYTRIACSLSTMISGLFGAILRKYLFDNKKPSVVYALAIGLVAEVMHMVMIFITNMSDIATAFVLVKKCAIPMITVNGIAVMLSVLMVTWFGKEKVLHSQQSKQISVVTQQWLLNSVMAAFLVTCAFTAVLQFRITDSNTERLLRLNINDMVAEITDASDRNLLALAHKVKDELSQTSDLDMIARKHDVAEINIVDPDGIIVDSNIDIAGYIGFDMASGSQSAEFMVLLDGQKEFVQGYQPISFNSDTSRKYAGVALDEGGFVQVGYDAEHFHADIAQQVRSVAVNRRIEQGGYIFIADEALNVVSTRSDKLGQEGDGDIQIDASVKEGERFTATFYGEEAYCMYTACEGYYVVGVLPVSEAKFNGDLSIYMMAFMEIVIFGALFILIYYLIKKLVVDNIRSVNNSLAQITKGNLNVVVNVRTNEEFASLSDDINATVDTLKQYIAEAAARIDKELELAKVIQESSLPSVFPPFPDRRELDIFASMTAAKEVGGDFYDFYLLDENRLAFLVADVSGKGITGAMFMMKAKTLIKSFAERGGDAAEILTNANQALCEGNDAEMFVTCFLAILDFEKGKIEYANAGHNPPLLRRKDGEFEYFKTRAGFVLGGMENICYRKGEMDFRQGDILLLYTDGVTEATNSQNELYGERRLQATLNAMANSSAESLCGGIKADVDAFVGEAPQFDDITMLCIRLVGLE